jgi:hypothetical protein
LLAFKQNKIENLIFWAIVTWAIIVFAKNILANENIQSEYFEKNENISKYLDIPEPNLTYDLKVSI